MPSTKIINVLRDDDFESVFNVFEGTSAKEVILILPKNSRFAKRAEHFMAIKEKADELGKVVNIMSEDVEMKEFVEDLGFRFLEISKPKLKKKEVPSPEIRVEPVMPVSAAARRGMADIIKPVSNTKIHIEPQQNEGPTEDEEIIINKEAEKMLKAPEPQPLLEEAETIEKYPEPEFSERESIVQTTPLDKQGPSDIEKLWFGLAKTSKRLKEKMPRTLSSYRSPSGRGKKIIAITAASVVLIIVFLSVFAKAQVVLRPVKQAINFEMEVTASTKISKVDSVKNIIPGQFVSVEDQNSGNFSASGQDDVVKKSEGMIRIVNNLSAKQVLVTTTRFRSPSNKDYRISQTVTIPAKGSLEIEITADKAGGEYKEESGTKFLIPGFKEADLLDKYENIYALAITDIDGGYVGNAKLVTEEDFNKAKEYLLASLIEPVKEKLKQRVGSFGLQNLISEIEFKNIKSSADINDVADKFDMTVLVEGRAMLFDDKHVKQLVNDYLGRSGGLEMVESLTTIEYVGAEFNETKDGVVFRLSVDGQAAPHINSETIVQNLLGKKEKEVSEYLRGISEISSAKILLSPFWIKSVPNDPERVKIDFEY